MARNIGSDAIEPVRLIVMNLRQQIIQDHVEALALQFHIPPDDAFLRYAHSLVTGRSIHSFDPTDIVDGGQDKQMDVISIEEQLESAEVFIVQTKNTSSFSSNILIQLRNGLSWLFKRARSDLDSLTNLALRDKILEYRALVSSVGPSNLRIHVRFVTNGNTSQLSAEFNQELKIIRNEYDNDTFEHFSIEAIGCDELVGLSKKQERQNRRVDAELKIKYDANNPSLIKYYAQGLKGLVCSVPASEIARMVNENPDGSVFDLNIRKFLGGRGNVNREISTTCTDVTSSYEFWFLNNGITIVCDHFDPVTDPDNPHVKIENLQIVNGCQTATSLAMAQQENKLLNDVRVLTRIYESKDAKLVNRIVLTTNNQNQITSRDLRANEPIQLDMEAGFHIYGYYYERKPRQFEEGVVKDTRQLFTNEAVAQAFLAVVLRNPSDARARKYKVWGELHSRIFSGGPVEPYIIAVFLSRKAAEWLRSSKYIVSKNDIERTVAKRGSFHVARICAFLWRGDDDWKNDLHRLKRELAELESNPDLLQDVLNKAFTILLEIIMRGEYSDDVDRAMKSASVDRGIDSALYKSKNATP